MNGLRSLTMRLRTGYQSLAGGGTRSVGSSPLPRPRQRRRSQRPRRGTPPAEPRCPHSPAGPGTTRRCPRHRPEAAAPDHPHRRRRRGGGGGTAGFGREHGQFGCSGGSGAQVGGTFTATAGQSIATFIGCGGGGGTAHSSGSTVHRWYRVESAMRTGPRWGCSHRPQADSSGGGGGGGASAVCIYGPGGIAVCHPSRRLRRRRRRWW